MSRKDLFNDVMRAANIMRSDDGTNGVYEYIEQISWMFFLKVFEDLENRFAKEAELRNEKYSNIINKKFSWSIWTKKDTKIIIDYVDSELFPYLEKLSGTPEKNTISLIFQEIQRNKMKSASNLKDVIDIVSEIDFNVSEDSHILSLFYEDLLIKLGKESGLAGEFYTPRPIVRLIVKMTDPQLNQKNKKDTKILDPFCGSCGFLVESFKHILSNKNIPSKDLNLLQRSVFHGFEKKSLPFLVGLMNCILHELITPNIIRKNSLNENILNFGPDEKFDFILTNPPFGGKENKLLQQNYPVKSSSTELLALQNIMRRLKNIGKCGIVLPEGLLSQGDEFKKVKKELVENFNLHTIVSLPQGVFANVTSSGKGPKTNLLFFDRQGPTKKIWYYELHPQIGKDFTKKNPVTDEHLEDCYKKWKERKTSNDSWIVDIKDVVKNDYDLSANNPKAKKKIKRNFDDLLENYEKTTRKITDLILEINKLRTNKFSFFTDLELGNLPKGWVLKHLGDEDVSKITMGQSPPGNTYNENKIGLPFYQGKTDYGKIHPVPRVWCSKPQKIAKKGDILISVRAPVGPTNWSNEECCIGRGLAAITPKINPFFVYYYLKVIESELQNFGQKGSVFNAMTKPQLFSLPIPVPSSETQQDIVDFLDEIYPKTNEILQLSKSVFEDNVDIPSSIIEKTMIGKMKINLKKGLIG
jgi:type I restriction enzyme M protein